MTKVIKINNKNPKIQITFPVGFLTDMSRDSQLAHLTEHLLFDIDIKPDDILLSFNAYTSTYWTSYYLEMTNYDRLVKIISNALNNGFGNIKESKFEFEKRRVCNEMVSVDNHIGTIPKILQSAFPKDRGYIHHNMWTIGNENINMNIIPIELYNNTLTNKDIYNFVEKYYREPVIIIGSPDNKITDDMEASLMKLLNSKFFRKKQKYIHPKKLLFPSLSLIQSKKHSNNIQPYKMYYISKLDPAVYISLLENLCEYYLNEMAVIRNVDNTVNLIFLFNNVKNKLLQLLEFDNFEQFQQDYFNDLHVIYNIADTSRLIFDDDMKNNWKKWLNNVINEL